MKHSSLFCLALILLLPLSAQAHKLSIFAWPEGSEIRGEVKFSGGRQAKNVNIVVQNRLDSSIVAETVCDEKGDFRLTLPEQTMKTKPDLLIIANGGEGHRGEWLLEAKEYAAVISDTAPPAQASASSAVAVNESQLRRIVAEELSKGLSPIRQSLAESINPEPGLRDILGGIGWILGIAGMAAWASRRKSIS
ncbi:MAG: nickel transport protein [Candidatus Electronema aureum]|uniref:Nickel transport protein n=1 Tax=Candidatus Electronema aureum TaxID=2005002 RepID=A0A521G5D4_9BACT|nr:MAG: nickel transport protein [Candidatus Electronema aureum]